MVLETEPVRGLTMAACASRTSAGSPRASCACAARRCRAQTAYNLPGQHLRFRPQPADTQVIANFGLTNPDHLPAAAQQRRQLEHGFTDLTKWKVYAEHRRL